MRARRSLMVVGVLLLLASCSSGGNGPTRPTAAPSTPSGGRSLAGTAMEPCTVGGGAYALCGTLTVPEDPWTEGGRTIDLRVAVLPAETAEPAGAVFFIAGGPGGASTVSWGSAAQVFPQVHADRDIVLVDQRGTGGSNELLAPEGPEGGFTGPDRVEEAKEWVAEVLAGLDADPTMYTTEVAIRDLEAVRTALGWDRVDLYGGSYGATVAQYYLRRFPDSVRSVVLDGGTLLDVPILELIAASSQAIPGHDAQAVRRRSGVRRGVPGRRR